MSDSNGNLNTGPANQRQDDSPVSDQKQRSTILRMRLLILSIALGLIVLSSGFCLAISWLSFAQSASQVKHQYRSHPVVVEKIGGIDQCRFSLTHTLNETNRYNNGITYMVYSVRGPSGSGWLICGQAPGAISVSEARLRVDGIDSDLD